VGPEIDEVAVGVDGVRFRQFALNQRLNAGELVLTHVIHVSKRRTVLTGALCTPNCTVSPLSSERTSNATGGRGQTPAHALVERATERVGRSDVFGSARQHVIRSHTPHCPGARSGHNTTASASARRSGALHITAAGAGSRRSGRRRGRSRSSCRYRCRCRCRRGGRSGRRSRSRCRRRVCSRHLSRGGCVGLL
jgi:hypothetical protein